MTRMPPIDALRTVVSAMGGSDTEAVGSSRQATIRRGIRLTACAPTILAAHYRMRQGKEPVAPNGELGHASNFLCMLSGELPDPVDSKVLDKGLILHAEHGANASSFVARTVASTGSDVYSSITAAIAALKGPVHGGAAERVIKMALEIGSAERAMEYVRDVLEKGERIAGFGHPIYKTADPRSVYLEQEARALAARRGHPAWFSTLEAVRRAMERYSKGVSPNGDLWSSAIYRLLGVPEDMFSSVFATGRLPGWIAHVVEQEATNVLLRPRLKNEGPADIPYIAIEQRC